MDKKEYSKEMFLGIYEKMLRIRKFELRLTEYFTKGMLYGNIHTSIGQEAVAVGVCEALEQTDFMTSTHRGHGHSLAKGAKSDIMMAE